MTNMHTGRVLIQHRARTPVARRPWRAAVLSLFAPGLGHVYAGNPVRGLAVWALSFGASVLGMAAALTLPGRWQVVGLVILIVLTPFLVALDAARTARRANPYLLRAFNRWYAYLGLLLLSTLVWQPLVLKQITAHVGNAARTTRDTMKPTLLEGERILSVPLRGPIQAGDIVIYRAVSGKFVHRVVALPGDTVAMHDGQLVLNGRAHPEPYARREPADPTHPDFAWQERYLLPRVARGSYRPTVYNWGPLVVPEDEYFLMGDNRSNAMDSRYRGFVVREDLVARPTIIYFSLDVKSGAIRWTRIGRAADR